MNRVITPTPLGGGGGGLVPTIRATAPVGSTVSCDGQTKVVGAEGFVDFVVDIGTYTVTAILDGKTATEEVMVDEIGLVNVELEPGKLYLYKYGDECTDVTGGWNADGWTFSTLTVKQPIKNIDSMFLSSGSGSAGMIGATVNKIPCGGFSKVCVDCKTNGATNAMYFGLINTRSITASRYVWKSLTHTAQQVIEVPISTTSEYYFVFLSDDTSRNGTIYAVWLE